MKAGRGKKARRNRKDEGQEQQAAQPPVLSGAGSTITPGSGSPAPEASIPLETVSAASPSPPTADPASRWPVAVGLLALCSIIFFGRFLFTGRIFVLRDLIYDFYPMLVFLKEHLLQGTLPFWNPYTGCGEPYFSNIQAGILYPLNIIHLLLPLPLSVSVSVALHAMIAGAGVWLCCRRWRVSGHGSLLAAIAFAFSTLMLTRIEFYPSLCSYAWYPVTVALFTLWIQGRRLWPLLAGAGAMSLQIYAGYPETLIFTGGTLLIKTGFVAARQQPGGLRARLTPVLGLAAMSALALLLSSAQLLSVLDLLPETMRSLMDDPDSGRASVNPLMLLASLLPFLYGSQGYHGVYWAPSVYEFWAGTFYVGVLPVALALAAVGRFLLGERRRPAAPKGCDAPALAPTPFLIATLIFFLLYAMGRYTPFFSIIWTLIPPLHWFRWPSKALLAVVFAASCLAGIALDWLGRETAKPLSAPLKQRLAAFGPAALLLGLAAVVGVSLLHEGRIGKAILTTYFNLDSVPAHYAHRIPWPLLATDGVKFVAMAMLSVILILAHGRPAWRQPALFLMPITLLADLMFTSLPLLPSSAMDLFSNQGPYLAQLKAQPQPGRFYRMATQQLAYGMTDETLLRNARDSFGASWAMVDKVHAVRATGTFRLEDIATLRNLLIDESLPEARRAFLAKLMNCTVGLTGSLHDGYFVGQPPQTPELYPLGEAIPRAFVVGRVKPYPDWDALLQALLFKDFDPLEVALTLDGAVTDADLHGGNGYIPHRVTRLADGLNHLTVEVESAAKGLLVVSDTYYDSWKATVNGAPVPIHEVNGAFRAVPIEAGKSLVEMHARSRLLPYGLAITLASLIFVGLLLAYDLRRGG